MYYDSSALLAYNSIMEISNEVPFGWWLRLIHSNGASFFFFVVYIHMAKNFFY